MLKIQNLTKIYGKNTVLDHVNMNIPKGKVYGLIGPNGAGKSTIMKILTGLINKTSGSIIFEGREWSRRDLQKIGSIIEEPPLYKNLNAYDNMKVVTTMLGVPDNVILPLLEKVGLGKIDRRPVKQFSLGMKQRLGIAISLINSPKLLILDEPTNDLDIVTLNVLEDFLLDYPGCLVVVSHDRYFMDKIVDHLFVFRGQGEVEDFPGNYTDYRVYEESTPPPDDAPKKEATKNTWRKDANKGLSFNEQKEYNRLEKEIAQLEEKKTAIEAAFAEGNLTNDEIQNQSVALQETLVALEEKTERWFELTERLDN